MAFSTFNPAEHLQTQEEIDLFLSECFQDENPDVFSAALADVIKAHGVAAVAEKAHLNRESLYKFVSGKTRPTWATIHKLILAMNIKIQTA
ncbi:MAG: putative addiction module antidote protein [Neisseriaceae bacterium]|nr:putative addiction module antidote protein [Neisseriaceae bacterium]MBQ9184074.1 putative addiction module antidote protein [Neisseriaceae bacterium]MBQ9683109.1 putative addiction module antidote protein [Neisseriaceae bacterium]MBR5676205.1 putative addiction module antidote protein [Neisseriaceae bacterium]MBR6027189.1 putative addiction module antidote protein [Neisseriaceae bacterium]